MYYVKYTELSFRVREALRRAGILLIAEIKNISIKQLKMHGNFGSRSAATLKAFVKKHGISLRPDPPIRVIDAMNWCRIKRIEGFSEYSRKQLLVIPGFGKKSLEYITRQGVSLKSEGI